jgi:hypothetical protein
MDVLPNNTAAIHFGFLLMNETHCGKLVPAWWD